LAESRGRQSGFDLFGVAQAGPLPDAPHLRDQIASGRHGRMQFLARTIDVRCDPRVGFPWAKSVICVARRVHSKEAASFNGIACYANAVDYHCTLGEMLSKYVGDMKKEFPRAGRARAFVDSGPVTEKAWARQAGLGFIGKNTLLIAPELGSRIHLGTILLEASIPPDAPGAGTCGDCRRCLDACPTGALTEAGRLDARLCIAYLTVERRGDIPEADRPKIGACVFGCDACQDACPHNRRGPVPADAEPETIDRLIDLSEADFDRLFGDTPVQRATWKGLRLNAITAAGNVGGNSCASSLQKCLDDPDPAIRERARWAIEGLTLRRHRGRLCDRLLILNSCTDK